MVAAIARLEKALTGVVKATVESTLGRLGTVGAIAVDDFIQRVASAVAQLRPVLGSHVAVSVDDVPVVPTLPAGVVSVGSAVPVMPSVASRQSPLRTPNREVLTATDLLQCCVDSSLRLQYMGFQEMRKVE